MISSRNTEYLINGLIFFQIIFGNGVDRLSLPPHIFQCKNFLMEMYNYAICM